MLHYVIFDQRTKKYLTDSNGNLIIQNTISDCYDYLEYILKVSLDILCDNIDNKYYRFESRFSEL